MSNLMSNQESLKYITTFKGMFEVRVPEGSPNSVQRTTKTGKSITVFQFNKLSGKLVDIKTKDSDYGKRILFHFDNNGEVGALEAPLSSIVTTTIVNRLPNLQLDEPFDLFIKYNLAKERAMIFVNQNGKSVEDYYQQWDKKANKWNVKEEYPSWEKKELNGETVWDKTKQIKFHVDVISKYMGSIKANQVAVPEEQPEPPQQGDEDEQEIPF